MRIAIAAGLLASFGVAAASDGPRGKAVRIEKPERREVVIPAGSFVQGLDEEQMGTAKSQCELSFFAPEQPQLRGPNGTTDFCKQYVAELVFMEQRQVFLDAYAIDRDEVSVTEYRRCVDSGGCALDALVAGDERYIHTEWPMVNVTWEEAQTFCRWRGGRLPTEAEWERAALGDSHDRDWPWGELEQPKDFNHGKARELSMRQIERALSPLPLKFFGDPDDSDGAALMAAPGSYPWGESPWGTRDQAGNVAEWTADAHFHDAEHVGYKGLSSVNPLREGPVGAERVIRGGSWRQPPFLSKGNLRDPFNTYLQSNARYSHVGFRCARTIR